MVCLSGFNATYTPGVHLGEGAGGHLPPLDQILSPLGDS